MKSENKSIQKTIRMTESVYQAVDGFDGSGFNNKFENLVKFCMFRGVKIQNDIDYLVKRKQRLSEELDNLEEAKRVVQNAMFQLVGIEDTLDKLKKRVSELNVFEDVSKDADGM